MPWAALLALTVASFITVLTEALPAGVLIGMSNDLGVSESAAGQAVTVYALGTALTAIPLSIVTARWRRKRLLLCGVAGFVFGNTLTAVSGIYTMMMVGRFVAGIAAGIVWALLAPYARRMAPEHRVGKATAIVMAGIPVALSVGVPAGTLLGQLVGWQASFLAMSAIAVLLMLWIVLVVPDYPGQENGSSAMPFRATLRQPGVVAVLFVTLVFVLAHNILYTYIATFLEHLGMGSRVDAVLLVFGVAAIVSIFVVGATIDRHLRVLSILGTVLVAIGATVLAVLFTSPVLVYAAVVLWGLGWGGVPTLLQTAVSNAGREYGDMALAMLVTLWNVSMAAGGVVGGALLAVFGPLSFPRTVLAMLVPTLLVVLCARRHGFPSVAPSEGSLVTTGSQPSRDTANPAR